jgi:hypothetical protein
MEGGREGGVSQLVGKLAMAQILLTQKWLAQSINLYCSTYKCHITLQYTSRHPTWSLALKFSYQNIACISCFSIVCYVPHLSHSLHISLPPAMSLTHCQCMDRSFVFSLVRLCLPVTSLHIYLSVGKPWDV